MIRMKQKNITKFIMGLFLIAFLIIACKPAEEIKNLEKKINTNKGELTLKYENGKATLSGILSRSTPCVDWNVNIDGTKDSTSRIVEFNIFNKNKGAICIQVLGEPQEINASASASEQTTYTVKLEDKIVFEGKLK